MKFLFPPFFKSTCWMEDIRIMRKKMWNHMYYNKRPISSHMVLAFVFVSIVWYYRRVEIKYYTEVKNIYSWLNAHSGQSLLYRTSKIWQILKRFSGSIHKAKTSFFSEEHSILTYFLKRYLVWDINDVRIHNYVCPSTFWLL